MLPCPKCAGDSKVYDSRYAADVIRRRRECIVCAHRWSTYETNMDPRELIRMGDTLRNMFAREARKMSEGSITAKGQGRLDRRMSVAEKKERNRKIIELYATLTAPQIAERLSMTISAVEKTVYREGIRKNPERSV